MDSLPAVRIPARGDGPGTAIRKGIKMTCDDLTIVAFINGELSREEGDALLDHMEQCAACDAAFRKYLQLKMLSPEIQAELPSGYFDFGETPSPDRRLRVMVGAAAAVLALLVVGLFLVRGFIGRGTGSALSRALESGPYEYVSPRTRGVSRTDREREAVMALYTAGRYQRFVPQAMAWVAGHPDDARMLFFAGVASYLEGKYADADFFLENAINVHGERRPEVLWYLANTRVRQGQYAAARPLLEELAGMDHPYASRARELLKVLPGRDRSPS